MESSIKSGSYTVRLDSQDNVVMALTNLSFGDRVEKDLVCLDPIPKGHKVATNNIGTDEPIKKYGHIIGFASRPIKAGELVHSHNVRFYDFNRGHAIGAEARPTEYIPDGKRAYFQGILRQDGQVGTRNHIGVLSTVSCSNTVARLIADSFRLEGLKHYPSVDSVVTLRQSAGCGMAKYSEGFELLQRTMGGYAKHPNFAGILVVGLGCEVNQIDCLLANMNLNTTALISTLNIQELGGTEKAVRFGVERIQSMLPRADLVRRQLFPANSLIVGLECGGSDAYSGLSANPALGAAADLVVRHGGTVILSETPEIYGAEHLLNLRAANKEIGEKLIERIQWWKAYSTKHGSEINSNVSPGNKAGGITNILEKSLGAVAKGGTTNLVEVYGYAEKVSAKGLVFMDTPGYDLVSMTGMIAGGANLICFTTGRGSVCGCKPVPALKLASNSQIYRSMEGDMDIDCGVILDGGASIPEMGQRIFQLILETASGRKTKSEILGFGDDEFIPWHIGAVT